MEPELGKEGQKEFVVVLENTEYLLVKREYYNILLLKAFKGMVRGSASSLSPGGFLEIQLPLGI